MQDQKILTCCISIPRKNHILLNNRFAKHNSGENNSHLEATFIIVSYTSQMGAIDLSPWQNVIGVCWCCVQWAITMIKRSRRKRRYRWKGWKVSQIRWTRSLSHNDRSGGHWNFCSEPSSMCSSYLSYYQLVYKKKGLWFIKFITFLCM